MSSLVVNDDDSFVGNHNGRQRLLCASLSLVLLLFGMVFWWDCPSMQAAASPEANGPLIRILEDVAYYDDDGNNDGYKNQDDYYYDDDKNDNDDNNDYDNNDDENEESEEEAEESEEEETRVINDDFYAFPEEPTMTLFPLDRREYIGFSLAAVCIILASAGGVGGGGMILPIYILVLDMAPSVASPLTAVSVFGGAVASTLWNACKRHPLADRPIFDWDLILVLEPVILVGTISGTMIQQVLSDSILVVLFIPILGLAAHRTLVKGRRMYVKEQHTIEKLKTFPRETDDASSSNCSSAITVASIPSVVHTTTTPANNEPQPIVTHFTAVNDSVDDILRNWGRLGADDDDPNNQNVFSIDPEVESSLKSEMTEEDKITPRYKIMAVCIMFTVAIFLNAMLGGGGYASPWGIYCGGYLFWLIHVVLFTFLFAFAWAARTYVVNRHEIKQLANYDFVHGDVKWDTKRSFVYPTLFLCAGLFAGMFGIGGGIVTVPLMLVMGVHPEVATATSGCMILFTSVASTTSYAVFGLIHWDYAAACALVGFVASLSGKLVMKRVKKYKLNGIKFKRESLIAFAVGSVLLLSGVLLTLNYIFIIEGYEEKDDGGICYNSRL